MSATRTRVEAGPLMGLLEEMVVLHDELAVVLRSKLEAMKKSNVGAIQSAAAREGLLVRKMAELDRRRGDVMAVIGSALGAGTGKGLTISRVAEGAEPAERERLLAMSAGLQQRVRVVAELHRVITIVSAEMLAHFRSVLTVMTRAGDEAGTYTRRGRMESKGSMRVLDAVG